MRDKVFEDRRFGLDDIDIPPEDPRMLRLHSRRQQIVARSTHGLPARTLGFEAMALLNILAQVKIEVLLDDRGAVEGSAVGPLLYPVKLLRQNCQGLVRRIGDEEPKIDKVMGIREFREQLEVGRKIRGSVLEGSKEKDPLFVLSSLRRRLDWVQVHMLNGRRVDLDRFVVVEYDGGLEVGMPLLLLVERHLRGWFGRAPAVKTVRSRTISLNVVASRGA